jgi:hypothetical protein
MNHSSTYVYVNFRCQSCCTEADGGRHTQAVVEIQGEEGRIGSGLGTGLIQQSLNSA